MPAKTLTYVLWSNEHQMWHKEGGRGYTPEIDEAVRLSEGQALDYVVAGAHSGLVAKADVMVAAPECFA
jgi:hypothetical protein